MEIIVLIEKVVGIFYYPWQQKYVSRGDLGRNPWTLYLKTVWYKANPRSLDYMERLFIERYPQGKFLNIVNYADSLDQELLSADEIILLYPDAIGLGFGALEHKVFKLKNAHSSVRVLNGRKRDFLLSNSARRALWLRRFLSRSMLIEFLVMAVMLIVTPLLFIYDLIRRKS